METFTGVGQILGGDTKPSRLVQSNLNKSTHTVEQQHTNVTSELPGIIFYLCFLRLLM